MVAKRSAGILLFRRADSQLDVLLGHMGGPFWKGRESGAWSIPKGEYLPDEVAEAAARREFVEELGVEVPAGEFLPLGEVKQTGGKTVTVWALASDLDPRSIKPGTFTMEWPKGSGRIEEFPELDRVEWFDLASAQSKIVAGQREFLNRLEQHLAAR
ncbi:NUDIX domain-containing protein [Jatrophihabitans sp. DSM 45814]